MRTQVAVEAPVLGVELDQRLRVVNRRLDLRLAAHDARIRKQPLHIIVPVVRNQRRFESGKRLSDSVPFVIDHAPADSGLEHGPTERLEVTRQVLWSVPGRRLTIHLAPPYS